MIGKLLGGTIGFFLLGPLGAIAGIALGDFYEDAKSGGKKPVQGPNSRELNQQYFFVCTFTLLGKLAKADGRICEKEISEIQHLMDNVLELGEQEQAFAIRIFRASRENDDGVEDYAHQFFKIFRQRPEILENLLCQMFILANADGFFHPEERKIIEKISFIFGFNEIDLKRIYAPFYKETDTLENAYNILGISSQHSKEDIKKTYRKLAMEHHPDRVIARGLPREFIKTANKKFAEIQNAYDLICKERNIK
jgi:DnaJ like chaperone protein